MDKISKIMKSSLKNKVKITQSLLVAFLITGSVVSFANQPTDSEPIREGSTAINITINNYPEEKGLELGTNGLSRGLGSITTGTDNIAIGKGAIATGNNETEATIKAKINENEGRLNEINLQESKVREAVNELEKLKKKNQDVIDAANRVDALNKSKANLLNEYNRLKTAREELERNSAEKLREHEEKIADLNSKLSGVANLGVFNIANDTELTEKANQFKSQVEANNSLNLSIDFYKDYISSYYNALGDLRTNEILSSYYHSYYDYYSYGSTVYHNSRPINFLKNDFLSMDDYIPYSGRVFSLTYNNPALSFNSNGKPSYLSYSSDNNYRSFKVYQDGNYKVYNVKNISTDVSTEEEYNSVKSALVLYRQQISSAFPKLHSGYYDLGKDEKIQAYLNKMLDLKIKKIELSNEITYFQWKYEQSGKTDVSWLNKKAEKLKEYEKLNEIDILKLNSEIFGVASNSETYLMEYVKSKYTDWKKKNIDDIKERNKITTDKLTADLEAALGVSREEIETINRNIQNAKNEENRALNNYNNVTISEKDLLLAREYENVVRAIKKQEEVLTTAQERLRVLKEQLTLNDFTDGKDAIAFGNNTLASGTNSIAFGKGNIVTAESGIAIGNTNLTTGESSIAIGHGNNSIGTNSIALGKENSVKGDKSITIGYKNKVDGIGSSVIGDPNIVYGDNVHILGNDNKVGADENNKKNNVFILGSNIDATNIDNAIVLGNSSTAVANALSIGNSTTLRKIVNVKEATISNTSNEVVTGKQLYEVVKGTSTDIDTDKWKEILGVGTIDENSIAGKLNTTMDNLGEIDNAATTKLITKLSEGANISTPANKLVTDTMVKTALDRKLDKTDSSTFIKIDGSNIDTTVKETLVTKLNNGVDFTNPTGKSLVTDSDVKDYVEGLGYITNADITNKVDRTELSNYYTKNESDSTFVKKENNIDKTNLDEEVGKAGYIKADALNNKLDSSEFTGDKITEKVTKGNINSTDLTVTGDGKVIGADITLSINDGVITKEKLANTLKTEIENKANSSDVYTKTETYNKDEVNNLLVSKVGTADLINKANTDASNISVEKFTEKLSEEANISNPKNKLTTDTKIKEYLDNNYYNNTEIDKKISNVKVKTEADIVSTTLDIENGENRIIGTENISIEVKSNSISKDKLDNTLRNEIDNKANINGNNIVKTKDKEDFRNAIEVYSKNEIETKLRDVTAGTVNLDGEISETEERGVKGKVIDKHLKENYVHKNDLAELGNTVKANTERINELEGKIKESTALSTALSSIEYPSIKTGEVGIGAGISSYQGKQGVAIGASYMPKEDLLLTLKYAGLTDNRFRGVVSASVGYKFRLHN